MRADDSQDFTLCISDSDVHRDGRDSLQII
jgi:hypothetical protein